MPLVIVCGVPCSGKTKRTEEMLLILQKRGKKVEVINDATCDIEYTHYGDFN